MSSAPRTRRVALLAVADVSASTLNGLYDPLHSAGLHWPLQHGAANPVPAFHTVVVSRDGRPLRLRSGVSVTPDLALADAADAEIVCIPNLEVPPASLDGRYDDEAAWLRARHAAGATVASACSGAVLLARTGLLDGLEALSHWACCDALRRAHPRTQWFPERSFARRVQAATGTSPLALVHAMRLEEAKPMLETTSAPVEAIAVDVGDQDPAFFSRLFRRRVAMTPAQYRRRLGGLARRIGGDVPGPASPARPAQPPRGGNP